MNSLLTPEHFYIIIPCYNCEKYIDECLKSLQRQTFQGWTALVADDCSKDKTAELVRAFMAKDERIKLRLGEKRAWLMGNTLTGLRSLNLKPSDVVAILDGDDMLMDGALESLWEHHVAGYDLVYTDEVMEGLSYSIGRAPIRSVGIRDQLWCFSHIRSFKAYLFHLLGDEDFRDPAGGYFRAAGDLSLYLPMAELAGAEKICFVPKKLYYYRIHDQCNFKVMRTEQLNNNRFIRSHPCLPRQTVHFDFTLDISYVDKAGLHELARETRGRFPKPFSVCLRHHISADEEDSWRAYHELWIGEGIFLTGIIKTEH